MHGLYKPYIVSLKNEAIKQHCEQAEEPHSPLFIYDLCLNFSMCVINPYFKAVGCCYSPVIGFSSAQGLLHL